jgi:hypothetical protein
MMNKKAKQWGVRVLDAETKQEIEFLCENYFSQCIYIGQHTYFVEFNFIPFPEWIRQWQRSVRPQFNGSSIPGWCRWCH